MSALTVEEATRRILSTAALLETEETDIAAAHGRRLATDLVARFTAPPFDASAMDGYAVRGVDIGPLPVTLRVVGEAGAGHAYAGAVGPGEAVRIFTGAPLPVGTDAIVIQENTRIDPAEPAKVTIVDGRSDLGHIRPRGFDFRSGTRLLAGGRRLGVRELTLAAAMGYGTVPLARRPRVGVLATGDELVLPGETPGLAQIVASNHLGVMAMAERAGAVPTFLGIARDQPADLDRLLRDADRFDVLVTIGGASVGDHDLVAPALARRGMSPAFWKLAMRPGKPMMYGRLGATHVLGLPGNPVSSLVCARLFVVPLIEALQGASDPVPRPINAMAGVDLEPNGPRAHYMRARTVVDDHGRRVATPVRTQDSSLLSVLAEADALIVRPIGAPATPAGATIPVLPLDF